MYNHHLKWKVNTRVSRSFHSYGTVVITPLVQSCY